MAIISKSIAQYRRRRRAPAATQREQRLSPDGPPPAQQARPGAAQLTDAGPAGTAAKPRPDGQPAKVAEAADREPRVPEGPRQGSRPAVIEVRGLRKSYDGVEAVASVDLEVCAGEIFAFLGPNGAGRPPRWRSWKATGAATRERSPS